MEWHQHAPVSIVWVKEHRALNDLVDVPYCWFDDLVGWPPGLVELRLNYVIEIERIKTSLHPRYSRALDGSAHPVSM